MENFILALAFDWRMLPAVALLSYFLGAIAAVRVRLGVRALLTVMPILLVFVSGAIGGCKPFSGEECMIGFGVALAFGWSGAWLLAVLVGAAARYLVYRRRR